MDPRIKILIVTLFMVTIFLLSSIFMYIPIIAFLILVTYLSKLKPDYLLKGIKPLRFIIILTFVINVIFTPGEELFSIFIFSITRDGLLRASFMAIRLVLLVVGTSILTLTTSPIELTGALEYIFSPLKRFGFPAHELAMMMTIALRFIPTLIEEADKIMKAQIARGADFESGNLIKKAKSMVPLLVPLFINSLRRASDLATAMESRCYHGGENKTRLNELKVDKFDYGATLFSVFIFALVVAADKCLNFKFWYEKYYAKSELWWNKL